MLIAANSETGRRAKRAPGSEFRRKTRVLCVVAAGRTACAAACPAPRSNACPGRTLAGACYAVVFVELRKATGLRVSHDAAWAKCAQTSSCLTLRPKIALLRSGVLFPGQSHNNPPANLQTGYLTSPYAQPSARINAIATMPTTTTTNRLLEITPAMIEGTEAIKFSTLTLGQ